MNKLIILFSLMTSTCALAASSGHGGEHSIPWGMIGQQALNLSIILAILVILLRKKVSQHFAERKVQYKQLIARAEEAKVEAEKSKREVTERLQQLKSNAEKSISQAKSEAEELKRKIVEEAQTLSSRLEEEARRTAEFELQRAKLQLRKNLLDEALKVAKTNLKSEVGNSEQQRLKSEFVDKIQVVQ